MSLSGRIDLRILSSTTIRFERTYKDSDGCFQSTPYLRDSDLLRARKLLDDADKWIEQDKGRNRATSAGQAEGRE